MKKIGLLISLFLVLSFASFPVFSESSIKVNVNGSNLEMNESPVIINGRTLVPLRVIFQALGVTPVWDNDTKTVIVKSETVNMSLTIGSKTAFVNNKSVPLEVPGTLVNGSTMVPVRFIAETFGATVGWQSETKTVMISTTAMVAPVGSGYAQAPENNNVKDFMDYLTPDQVLAFQSTVDRLKSTYGLEPVIVITNNVEGKSSMVYADDYYDNNGYGIGNDNSGILMLINMNDRVVWISTTGKAIDIFTDSRIASMLDGIASYLSKANYDGACNRFLSDVETYALQGVPEGQYRTE